jgi:hypothetical protein
MSQCPTPLLGRDILTKFQASISFNLRPIPLLALMATDGPSDPTGQILPSRVDPKVWDTDTPFLATCHPVKILLQTLITFCASLSTPFLLPACWGYNQSLLIYSTRSSSDPPIPHTTLPS